MIFRWRQPNRSEPDRQSIRKQLVDRPKLTDDEFLQKASLPDDALTAAILRLVRHRLSEVGKMPANSIWPDDAFDGEFGSVLEWPEFESSICLASLARDEGLRLDANRLEKVTDPSSCQRRGSVSQLILELRAALLS